MAAALRSVLQRVKHAAEKSGRGSHAVRVVAVSKTKPVALIRQVYNDGHRCVGENYVQEIVEKAPQVRKKQNPKTLTLASMASNQIASNLGRRFLRKNLGLGSNVRSLSTSSPAAAASDT